jgi:hypothetical protein
MDGLDYIDPQGVSDERQPGGRSTRSRTLRLQRSGERGRRRPGTRPS